jgi:small subunit ribosomal protein S19e
MASIYDVNGNELIEKAAEELKKNENIKPPEWAGFVKTGMHKERVPADKDWWYMRTAAVLRTIYRFGPIGVSKLRVKYGGRKRRGHKREHFYPGSGSIIRKVLQQLEKAGYLEKELKMQHRGRRVTAAGKSFLDKLSTQIYKVSVPKKVKVEEKKEVPKEEKPVKAKKVPEVKKDVEKPAEVKEEVKEKPAEVKK